MTSQPDQRFIRGLVLHCLDYLPTKAKPAKAKVTPEQAMAPGETLVHPDRKDLEAIQHSVNLIRSEYYSWFLALISKIPEGDIINFHSLASQVRCLELDNKYEEFLVTCAVLVQIAHFVIMKYKCLDSVDNASRSLTNIFLQKYQILFTEPGAWEEFVGHCAATAELESKKGPAKDEDDPVGPKELCTPWCKAANEKNILDFWNKAELGKVREVAEAEQAALKLRLSTMKDPKRKKMVMMRYYNVHLRRRVTDYRTSMSEPQKNVETWKKCPVPKPGFCLGCFLTAFYPEVKEEPRSVKHTRYCLMQRNKHPKDPSTMKDYCATVTPRTPELVLNFVQKNLDFTVGTCVLKGMRYKTYQELDVDAEVEICKLCLRQCVKKFVVCMDLYAAACV